MEPIEDNFFASLKTVFENEQVPYRPGAWENFKKQEKRNKRTLLFPILSTAAVMVICSMIYFWPQADQPVEGAVQIITPGAASYPVGGDHPKQSPVEMYSGKETLAFRKEISLAQQRTKEAQALVTDTVTNDLFVYPGSLVHALITNTSQAVPAVKKLTAKDNDSKALGHMPNERSNLALVSNPVKTWKLSAQLNNSYNSADRLNLGFGAAVALQISKRVALSSGIAYNQLAAKMTTNNIMISGNMEKTLTAVYTNVSGIDIPLEIKYNLSKNTEIGIGLSAMAVLRQQQTRNYIDANIVVSSYTDEQGELRVESKTVVENTEEMVKNDDLSPKNYLGFYNLSIGRRQKISNNNYITVEPFVKLPMQSFSSEKVKLISGGIRLKVDL